MAPTLPATIDDLGVPGSLDLGALLFAQQRRLNVAPTRREALAVLERLRALGLIDMPWPEPKWEIAPEARDTPIEGLQWRLDWSAYFSDGIADAATEFLRTVPPGRLRHRPPLAPMAPGGIR